MKGWRFMVGLLILLFPFLLFSDEIKLTNITVPGGSGNAIRIGMVLGENLIGPYKVTFSGIAPGSSVPILSREEINASGGSIGSFDELITLYSGRIYSPARGEPFVFENKTPKELVHMETTMFPDILELPYTLYIDLTIQASSHPKDADVSDDAGTYTATLTISLHQI